VATAKKKTVPTKKETGSDKERKEAAIKNDDDGARKGRGCTESQPRPPGNYDYYL